MITNSSEHKSIGAALIMEDLFETGLYQKRTVLNKRKDAIKEEVKNRLLNSDHKRHEFHGVVAKFQPVPVYETDQQGLMEYLDDYGLLPLVTKFDQSKIKQNEQVFRLINQYLVKKEYYAQFYLNKIGKSMLDETEHDYQQYPLESLSFAFLETKAMSEAVEREYQKKLAEIATCPFLRQAESLKSSFGTVKLREKGIEYANDAIYTEYGSDLFFDYGKIHMQTLEDFLYQGIVSKKEINQFRKVVDIQMRFILMDLESERKAAEFFQKEQNRKAQMLRFA